MLSFYDRPLVCQRSGTTAESRLARRTRETGRALRSHDCQGLAVFSALAALVLFFTGEQVWKP